MVPIRFELILWVLQTLPFPLAMTPQNTQHFNINQNVLAHVPDLMTKIEHIVFILYALNLLLY